MFFYVAKLAWMVFQPSSLLLLSLAGALWSWFRNARKLTGWSIGAAFAILLMAVSPLPNVLTLPLEERFARADLAAGEVAGVIVLGGAEEAPVALERNVYATNEAGERISEAVGLARLLPQARIVFTGGTGALFPGRSTEALAVKTMLVGMGVQEERIVLEDKSRDTWENAVFTKALVRPQAGERWLLVTSAWHMPRSMGVFRAADFTVEPWPVDYRTVGWGDATTFFRSPADGLRRLDLIAKEYTGLLFYWLKGRSSSLFPGPCREASSCR